MEPDRKRNIMIFAMQLKFLNKYLFRCMANRLKTIYFKLFGLTTSTVQVRMKYLSLHGIPRSWDTLHTKVPMEKAYLGHVDLLRRFLDYGKVSNYMQVSHVLVFSLYSIVISVPDP